MRRGTMNALLALALAVPASAAGQAREDGRGMTERAAAAALMDSRLTPERDRALALALELGPRAGAELRGAVIDAAWAEWRGETDRPEGSEAVLDYMDAVAALRDPRAIPFLIATSGTGQWAANALADLGAAAFPAVLAAASDAGEYSLRVAGGVTALRFMVEDGSLDTRQLERVRAVARNRLSGTQDYMVARDAVRLAVVIGDPELRRTVERIAADRAAAETLVSPYLSDGARTRFYEDYLNSIQDVARRLLAGPVDFGPFRRPGPASRKN